MLAIIMIVPKISLAWSSRCGKKSHAATKVVINDITKEQVSKILSVHSPKGIALTCAIIEIVIISTAHRDCASGVSMARTETVSMEILRKKTKPSQYLCTRT